MIKSQIEINQLLNEYCREVIQPSVLPNASINGGVFINFVPTVINLNIDSFAGSEYDLQADASGIHRLLHFTTIESYLNIVRNKNFRMYELSSMNDELEYTILQTLIEKGDKWDQIDKFKSSHFVLSTCKYNEDVIDNSKMWKDYADDTKGVCIEFTISNEQLIINSSYQLNKIRYLGNKIPKDIVKLNALHKQFSDANKGLPPKLLNIILSRLSSFYKDKDRFEHENEVRLLFEYRDAFEDRFIPIKEVEFSYNSEKDQIIRFHELQIESQDTYLPQIKIEKIYIKSDTCRRNNYLFDIVKNKFRESFNRDATILQVK